MNATEGMKITGGSDDIISKRLGKILETRLDTDKVINIIVYI